VIKKSDLLNFYIKESKSMEDISKILDCSLNKVKYWMVKYGIKRRSISEAVYLKNNPDGDPFKFKKPSNLKEAELFGVGIGLYWGEGTKASKDSVRLGNTDPKLIKKFIEFLIKFFGIEKEDLRFGLQIFTDTNVESVLSFWIKELKVGRSQFYKPTVTISGSIGSYKKRSEFGVLQVLYHNKKLRDLLFNKLPM